MQNSQLYCNTGPFASLYNYIFRENSRKVDEHFSLFFVNFTKTKESLFGNFSRKYGAQ